MQWEWHDRVLLWSLGALPWRRVCAVCARATPLRCLEGLYLYVQSHRGGRSMYVCGFNHLKVRWC